jgi:peroxiredoxin
MDAFLSSLETQPSFPIIVDPKGAIASQYKLEGMPTTVFIDRKGIVQYVHSGFVEKDKKEYRDRLLELVGN